MSDTDDSDQNSRGVMLSSVLRRIAARKPREEVAMIVAVIECMVAISFCVVIVWSWVTFIAEAICRRRGTTCTVPWPDEVLWMLSGKTLLDLGRFGGAPLWEQRLQQNRRRAGAGCTPKTGTGGNASKSGHRWKKGVKQVLAGSPVAN